MPGPRPHRCGPGARAGDLYHPCRLGASTRPSRDEIEAVLAFAASNLQTLDVPEGIAALINDDLTATQTTTVAVARFLNLIDYLDACRHDVVAYFHAVNLLHLASTRLTHMPAQVKTDLLMAHLDPLGCAALAALTETQQQDFKIVCNALAATCDRRARPTEQPRPAQPAIQTAPHTAPQATTQTTPQTAPQTALETSRSTAAMERAHSVALDRARSSTPASPGQARQQAFDLDASNLPAARLNPEPHDRCDGLGSPAALGSPAPWDDSDDFDDSGFDLVDQADARSEDGGDREVHEEGEASQPRRGRGKRVGSSTYYRQDRAHRNRERNVRKAFAQARLPGGKFAPRASRTANADTVNGANGAPAQR